MLCPGFTKERSKQHTCTSFIWIDWFSFNRIVLLPRETGGAIAYSAAVLVLLILVVVLILVIALVLIVVLILVVVLVLISVLVLVVILVVVLIDIHCNFLQNIVAAEPQR